MTTLGLTAEPPQAGTPTPSGQTTPATLATPSTSATPVTETPTQQAQPEASEAPAAEAPPPATLPNNFGMNGGPTPGIPPGGGPPGPGWQHEGMKKPPYTVNPDVQTNKIFIGGVPAEATKRDVRTTFLKFGQIKEALLPRDPRDRGRHRGFAFISFEEPQSVNAVLKDGPKVHKVCGKLVECKRAIPHPTKGIVTGGTCRRLRSADHRIIPAEFEAGYKNNLYVTGLPAEITKKEIEELFGAKGEILSTKLGRSEGKQRTAFVAFLEDSSAAKAMRELNGKPIKGTALNVSYAYHVTRHPRKPKYHPNSKKNGLNLMVPNGPHPPHNRGFNGWNPGGMNGFSHNGGHGGRGKFPRNNSGPPNHHGAHLPPMYYNVMMPPHNSNGKRKKPGPKNSLPEIPHVDPLSRPGAGRNKGSKEKNYSFSAEKVMEAQMRLKQAHDTNLRQHPGDAWHLKSRSSARGGNTKNGWPPFGNNHSNNNQMYAQNGVSRGGFDMQQMPHPVMMPPTHMPNMPPYCASPQNPYYYQPYPYSPQHSTFSRPPNYPSQPSYSIPEPGHQSQLSSSNNAMVQNSNGVYTFPSNGVTSGNGSLSSGSEENSPPQSPTKNAQNPADTSGGPGGKEELLQKLWDLTMQIQKRDPANKEWDWKQLRTVLKTEATSQLGEAMWKNANDVLPDGWTVLKRLKVRLRDRATKDGLSATAGKNDDVVDFYNETKEA